MSMRVLLLSDGGYGDAENVRFPVGVEALAYSSGVFVKISELKRVGLNFDNSDHTEELYFNEHEFEVVPTVPAEQTNKSPCDITNMCCNQFGERDEMQSIINSLQADVIARGARIADLEREVERLQRRLDHNE